MPSPRAIAIIRVSNTAGREGESFASPETQRDQIQAACKRENLKLIRTYEELDVSGGKPLADRPGLREAVAAIEAGEADVIAAAYFDRLFRSLQTQAEVIERVEQAGGQLLAVDVGRVTNGTATKWLSSTLLGAFAEYYRRTTGERVREAQVRAVARGVIPYPGATPGYVRNDGRLVPDPITAPVVADAFELRADGGTIADVRELLADGGVILSYAGVARLMASRVVLGEIHFGELVNLEAHEPIVDRDVWQRVQRLVVTRGRNAKSNRLLARLGVLQCGSCGARMIAGMANQTFPTYRCPPTGDCERRVTISAGMVESAVVEAVNEHVHDVHGIWDRVSETRRQAEATLESAQAQLDAAIAFLTDFTDESAKQRVVELRQGRDAAQERVERLGGTHRVRLTLKPWDKLTYEEQRERIKTLVESVYIYPGRGPGRIEITLIG